MQTTLEKVPAGTLVFKATLLSNALISLGIRPFKPETVEAYKTEMIERNPPSFWFTHRKAIEGTIERLCVATIILLFFSAVITAAASAGFLLTYLPNGSSEEVASYNSLFADVFIVSGSICLISLATTPFMVKFVDGEITIPVRGPAEWVSLPLSLYPLGGKSIPADADDMAQRIVKTFPQARFHVEELRQSDYLLDPFLVATDPETGEEYHVFQWDEPLFVK